MPSDGDSRAAYAALGEAGWIGLHWPEELGGRGLSPLHTVACEERFGYHWLPLSGYLLSVKTIGNALGRFAAPALQERLLPEVAAGRLLFCQGFSEPDAGSDLAALRTTARDAGDRFVVSGRKLWTSSAEVADWIYLAVRTGPGRATAGSPCSSRRSTRPASPSRRTPRSAAARSARSCWRTSRSRATSSSGRSTAAGRC